MTRQPLQDSLHHPRWRISRPTKGWYLILQRVTSLGPNEPYIELKPAKKTSSGLVDFLFTVRTPVRSLQPPDTSAAAGGERKSSSEVRLNMSPTLEPLVVPPPPTSFAMSPSASTSSSTTAFSSSSADAVLSPRTKHGSFPSADYTSSSSYEPTTFRLSPSLPHSFAAEHPHASSLLGRIKKLVAEPKKRWSVVREPSTRGEEKGEGEGGVVMAFEEGDSGFVSTFVASFVPSSRRTAISRADTTVVTTLFRTRLPSFLLFARLYDSSSHPRAPYPTHFPSCLRPRFCSFFHPHLSGLLSLSHPLVDASGLEPSFWVALCCAYADVVEEREGWEAANGD